MADKTVNIDYLCIIREKNGKTAFETVSIPKSVELVTKLEGIVENSNASVLDMQAQMNLAFSEVERRSIDYVSPHSYASSFIDKARYPVVYTFESYNEKLVEMKDRVTSTFASKNESLQKENPVKYQAALKEYVEERLASYKTTLKQDYLRDSRRFICADNYTRTLSSARSMGDVRMYSTDTRGWSDFDYRVTDEISIHLGTNFAYGSSSYFRLILRYKGIEILPYSYMVKYYFANLRDLLRYTRLYDVAHDSWNIAFAFVEETANLASASAQQFLEKWVLNEVKEMVYGLHGILEDPAFHVRDMVNHAGKRAECGYLSVRNMCSNEKSCYGVYPEEMTMAIQAEKLTGALDFLGNLTALSKLIPDIEGFISEIKTMAVAIVPGLDAMVERIVAKVAARQEEKAGKELDLVAVRKALEPYEDAIDRLYEARTEQQRGYSRTVFAAQYARDHKDYAEKKAAAEQLESAISKLAEEIRMRESFRKNLLECRQRVSDAGLISAPSQAA